MSVFWGEVREAAAGLLYPRVCAGCERGGGVAERSGLCAGCREGLSPVVAPVCEKCGEPYPAEVSGPFRCSNCAGRSLSFDFAVAAYRGEGLVREMIHRFKYQQAYHLGRVLGVLIEEGLRDERVDVAHDWLLVPVPRNGRGMRAR
jgi:predicted amidophosphoribosyltransferase